LKIAADFAGQSSATRRAGGLAKLPGPVLELTPFDNFGHPSCAFRHVARVDIIGLQAMASPAQASLPVR